MLQTIRENSQGIIAKAIVGLIALTFALWGVESLVSLTSREPAPAEVNGEDITQQQLLQGMELQRRQLLAQMGENADPAAIDDKLLREMVLEGLIQRTALLQPADDMGFHLSEQMVDQIIVSTPQFQVDGRFDRNQFEAVLRSAGFTPLMYRDLIRKEKLIEQAQAGYLLSEFATDDELDRLVALDRQTRDLGYVTLKADPDSIQISEQDLQTAYEARRDQFVTQEQVSVDYLLLDQHSLADPAAVTDADIQAAYDRMVAGFQAQEERSARHILIDITADRDEDAALARALELRDEIQAGADFAEVARRESGDLGSAAEGGELGFNARGAFVEPFEDALFSLQVGEISEPVRTEFGYHLIQLEDIRETEVPALEEVAGELRQQVADDKAELDYVAALDRLADLTFSSADLEVAAEELGLEIHSTPLFSRQGGSDLISAQPRVIEAAFGDTVLQEQLNSDPIELDSGRTLVLHLKEHQPSREQSLDEVRETLLTALRKEAAERQVAEQAGQWIERLKAGESLQALSEELEWTEAEGVTRGSDQIPAAVLRKLFAMPAPAEGAVSYSQVGLNDGEQAIIALRAVTDGEVDLSADERRSLAAMIANQRGQQIYQAYSQDLVNAAEIEKN